MYFLWSKNRYLKIIQFITRTQYLIQVQNCLNNAFDKKKITMILLFYALISLLLWDNQFKNNQWNRSILWKQGHRVLLKIHINAKIILTSQRYVSYNMMQIKLTFKIIYQPLIHHCTSKSISTTRSWLGLVSANHQI